MPFSCVSTHSAQPCFAREGVVVHEPDEVSLDNAHQLSITQPITGVSQDGGHQLSSRHPISSSGGGDHHTTAKQRKAGKSSLADVGLLVNVRLDRAVKLGVRVTVRLPEQDPRQHLDSERRHSACACAQASEKLLSGCVVSPDEPRAAGGHWGYTIRIAEDIEEVFTRSLYGRVRAEGEAGAKDKVRDRDQAGDGDGEGVGYDAAVLVVSRAGDGGSSGEDESTKEIHGMRQALESSRHLLVAFGGDTANDTAALDRGTRRFFGACLWRGRAGSAGGLIGTEEEAAGTLDALAAVVTAAGLGLRA